MSTGLTVKGNKKRAEAILAEKRRTFQPDEPVTSEILFADFMEQWLRVVKSSIAVPTYASYTNMVKRVISPYFREKDNPSRFDREGYSGFLSERA
jgi:hypothetical protein